MEEGRQARRSAAAQGLVLELRGPPARRLVRPSRRVDDVEQEGDGCRGAEEGVGGDERAIGNGAKEGTVAAAPRLCQTLGRQWSSGSGGGPGAAAPLRRLLLLLGLLAQL